MLEDKQIIIDVCPYQGECSISGCKRNDDGCFVRQLFEERYRAENQIVDLNKMVEAKERECDMLKEARKDSRCAWKSLEGTFCLEAQEQLNQLKSDNKHLNDLLNQALKELEEHREAFEKVRELIQKEIADCEHCGDCTSCEYNCCLKQAKQICDEVKE